MTPGAGPLFDLTGRVALVTGAGQGVGAAVAAALAGRNAAVAVNDVVGDRARGVAQAIAEEGGRAVPVVADVTDPTAVAAALAEVRAELGPVDVLVNNAGLPAGGGFRFRPFAETAPPDWEGPIALNLYGLLHCVHAVLPAMVDRGWGRIVVVSSEAGRVGEPGAAIYAAAKAGAVGFARALAKEVGRHGVTTNAVSLGSIAAEGADPERVARLTRAYPAGRLGRPADVAAAVVWLASEEAAWVTGQTVPVNGGYATS